MKSVLQKEEVAVKKASLNHVFVNIIQEKIYLIFCSRAKT